MRNTVVLNPERSGDERYRYYTDMDIFMLFDAMRYKEWGINIAEIGDLVANDYYDRLILKLQEYRRNLDQEIAYKEVRKRRVAWMERRLTLAAYPMGKGILSTVISGCRAQCEKLGIKPITNATVTEITENSVSFKDAEEKEVTIPAATVVSAFGYRSYNPLEEAAKAYCGEVYTIGSAVKAGNAMTAIKEGYEAGFAI